MAESETTDSALAKVLGETRALVRHAKEQMEHVCTITLRLGPERYPPSERRTPGDWIALRCEVEHWILLLERALAVSEPKERG